MIWIFTISATALVILIGVKMFELKTERVTFVSRTIIRLDTPFNKFADLSLQKMDFHKKSLENFFTYRLSFYSRETITGLKSKAKEKYDLISEKSRGKLNLQKGVRESDFWKSVSDHKSSLAYKKAEIDKWGND